MDILIEEDKILYKLLRVSGSKKVHLSEEILEELDEIISSNFGIITSNKEKFKIFLKNFNDIVIDFRATYCRSEGVEKFVKKIPNIKKNTDEEKESTTDSSRTNRKSAVYGRKKKDPNLRVIYFQNAVIIKEDEKIIGYTKEVIYILNLKTFKEIVRKFCPGLWPFC